MKAVYQTAVQKYEEYGHFLNPEDLLKWTIEHFGVDKIVMGTGFGAPGVVLLDILKKVNKSLRTNGRLFLAIENRFDYQS